MILEKLPKSLGRRPKRKRKGQGVGTGNGKTAGRGHKGQKARTGGSVKLFFEGGQVPLKRKLPFKRGRGFTNVHFKKAYAIVNVEDLEALAGQKELNINVLKANGIVPSTSKMLKVLGRGEITKAIKIVAEKVSDSARSKIESAGGSIELLQEKTNA